MTQYSQNLHMTYGNAYKMVNVIGTYTQYTTAGENMVELRQNTVSGRS